MKNERLEHFVSALFYFFRKLVKILFVISSFCTLFIFVMEIYVRITGANSEHFFYRNKFTILFGLFLLYGIYFWLISIGVLILKFIIKNGFNALFFVLTVAFGLIVINNWIIRIPILDYFISKYNGLVFKFIGLPYAVIVYFTSKSDK